VYTFQMTLAPVVRARVSFISPIELNFTRVCTPVQFGYQYLKALSCRGKPCCVWQLEQMVNALPGQSSEITRLKAMMLEGDRVVHQPGAVMMKA